MLGQPCSSCGARNRDDALYCWRCYQRFPGASWPPPSILRGLNPPAYSGYPTLSAVSTPPANLSPFAVGLIKRLASVAVLLIGVWWTWNALFAGFPFPDQVSGEERIESELVASGVEFVQDMIDATGADVEVDYAFYGSETQPRYMMFVVQSDEEDVRRLLRTQTGGSGGTAGAMECTRDRTGSTCVWFQDEAVMGLYGWGDAAAVLNVTAGHVRDRMN